MEVAAQVRPACRLAELDGAVGPGIVEFGIALVTVRRANGPLDRLLALLTLQDPLGLLEVLADVLFLPVWGEAVDGAGRHGSRPWALAVASGARTSGATAGNSSDQWRTMARSRT